MSQILKIYWQQLLICLRRTRNASSGLHIKNEGKQLLYNQFITSIDYKVHKFSSNRTLFPLLERWDMKSKTLTMHQLQDSTSLVIEGTSDSKLETVHTINLWEISSKV